MIMWLHVNWLKDMIYIYIGIYMGDTTTYIYSIIYMHNILCIVRWEHPWTSKGYYLIHYTVMTSFNIFNVSRWRFSWEWKGHFLVIYVIDMLMSISVHLLVNIFIWPLGIIILQDLVKGHSETGEIVSSACLFVSFDFRTG